jgi:hypothetical protein
MESIVSELPVSQIEHLRSMLQNEGGLNGDWSSSEELDPVKHDGDLPRKRLKVAAHAHHNDHQNGESYLGHSAFRSVVETLRKFVAHVCQHAAVVRSPPRVTYRKL